MSDIDISTTQDQALREAFEARLANGFKHMARRELAATLPHFEAAHILGQGHTLRHLRSHVALLRWGWLVRSPREIVGQLARLVGAALITWLWVPLGNPGSTRVGAFTPQPLPPDLSALLGKESRQGKRTWPIDSCSAHGRPNPNESINSAP